MRCGMGIWWLVVFEEAAVQRLMLEYLDLENRRLHWLKLTDIHRCRVTAWHCSYSELIIMV